MRIQRYQGEMIKATKKVGKIPLFYAYIVAFEARFRKNLQDCDVSGSNNLCTDGSNFIRANRDLLVSRYAHHAKAIAAALGDKNAVNIWVMEPDFWLEILFLFKKVVFENLNHFGKN